MQGEDAIKQLDAMFAEYLLDEYKDAYEAFKAEWLRVCKDNREMRERLHREAKQDGKGTAA